MEDYAAHVRKPASFKRKFISSLIAIGLLGGGFYWYQIRPHIARQDCALDAGKRAFIEEANKEGAKGLEKVRIQNEMFESHYKLCVRSKGLAE